MRQVEKPAATYDTGRLTIGTRLQVRWCRFSSLHLNCSGGRMRQVEKPAATHDTGRLAIGTRLQVRGAGFPTYT